MNGTSSPTPLIRVERVALRGPGAVILTGHSDCARGEVAHALGDLLSIDPQRRLSMGAILRSTIERSRSDAAFADLLEERHSLSRSASVFDCLDSSEELIAEVRRHRADLEKFLGRLPSRFISDEVSEPGFVSQLDWLDYCTARGLLSPDRWTEELIAAEIEGALARADASRDVPFLIEGYPRTPPSARQLLALLGRLEVPVLKILHLSIGRPERSSRAGRPDGGSEQSAALRRRLEQDAGWLQPTVDYLRGELGADRVARVDARRLADGRAEGGPVPPRGDREPAMERVVASALRALGVPGVIVGDLLERCREERGVGPR